MRLTLWQQFSSNHSADFTVVGTFQTADSAEQVAAEMREILKTIQRWYQQPENRETIEAILEEMSQDGGSIPMPIEVELGQKYGFAWDEQAPDSLWYAESPDVTQAVLVRGHHVFISSFFGNARTWSGSSVMTRLLRKLGGKAYGSDGMSRESFTIVLKWSAPDEATAAAILRDYQAVQNIDYSTAEPKFVESVPFGFRLDSELTHDEFQFTLQIYEINEPVRELDEIETYLQKLGCCSIEYQFTARGDL